MSAPSFVSVREFARLDGCNEKLVRRAIKSGKLPVSEDGRVDRTLAGTGWRRMNRRGADSADTSENVRTNVRTRKKVSTPDTTEVESRTEELFTEEAESFLDQVLAGKYADLVMAERIKENALAAKHLLAARKDAGNLVEIELAKTVLFETQRAQRDAWLNFPTRIGPLMAADLGVEADKVVEVLTAHVHQQLDDLGEPEASFIADGEG